jgi:hypothetical protein
VPIGAVGLAIVIAGWVLVAVLAITPLVIPALVAFRVAIGGAARLDGELANELLGTSVKPRVMSPGDRNAFIGVRLLMPLCETQSHSL